MSFITSIGISNPPHRFKQVDLASFMINAMELNEEDARKTKSLYRTTGIDTRYSVLADYGKQNGFDFFPDNKQLEPFPTTTDRMSAYRKHALAMSIASANDCLRDANVLADEVTHLIVVSCTGMYAPGLDIDLVKALNLRTNVQRTCINFMGCYAAFNAIKLGDALCKSNDEACVLIVCTELCSLHFQKKNTPDNLLANALFADGSASVFMTSKASRGWNLEPASFHCDLLTRGEKDMSWQVGDNGFEMQLSGYVPQLISEGISDFTQSLMNRFSADDVSYFAVHPGGKKILEVIERELKIPRDKNRFSHEVLRNFGNMSSPTVLFVLHQIVAQLKEEDNNQRILSFAFGPGLTLESMLLNIKMS